MCIDGDALLDPQALRWIARVFRRRDVGGVAGNPRIRNRTSLLGRLQVGEFSSIIGLIRRAQTTYGRLFTVSGVICAFRKRALEEAGWWSPRTITDDIDVTWRVQLAGWRVIYEPNAIVWILMPETLRGLWKQRLRWAEGGVEMMIDFFAPMIRGRAPSLLPTYINFVLSLLWAYCMLFALIVGILWAVGRALARDPAGLPAGARMVGAHARPHLSGAGAGQPPRRAPLRAEHAARPVLDHLVSVGLLAAQHAHHRRGPAARRWCGRAARPGKARIGGCDEQAAPGRAGRR